MNFNSSFFNDFFENIQKIIRKKVDEVVRPLIRVVAFTLTGITIVLRGVFHLSVGIVKYFSVVFGSEAVAYGLVGIIRSIK